LFIDRLKHAQLKQLPHIIIPKNWRHGRQSLFADQIVNDPNEQPVNDVEGIKVLLYPNEQLDSDVETIETVAV
jgi:hypothetical protein